MESCWHSTYFPIPGPLFTAHEANNTGLGDFQARKPFILDTHNLIGQHKILPSCRTERLHPSPKPFRPKFSRQNQVVATQPVALPNVLGSLLAPPLPPPPPFPLDRTSTAPFSLTGEGRVDDPEEEAEGGERAVGGLLVRVFGGGGAAGEYREEHKHGLRHDDHHAQEEAHGEGCSVLAHDERASNGKADQEKHLFVTTGGTGGEGGARGGGLSCQVYEITCTGSLLQVNSHVHVPCRQQRGIRTQRGAGPEIRVLVTYARTDGWNWRGSTN